MNQTIAGQSISMRITGLGDPAAGQPSHPPAPLDRRGRRARARRRAVRARPRRPAAAPGGRRCRGRAPSRSRAVCAAAHSYARRVTRARTADTPCAARPRRAPGVVAVRLAGQAGGLAGCGERVGSVDEQGRRAVHAGLRRPPRVGDLPPDDRMPGRPASAAASRSSNVAAFGQSAAVSRISSTGGRLTEGGYLGASCRATWCRIGELTDSCTLRANSHSRTRPGSRPARRAMRPASPAGSAASRSSQRSMCCSTS
jgi:hypothetical protein